MKKEEKHEIVLDLKEKLSAHNNCCSSKCDS
jgi:hypothetical protein